MSPKRYEHVFFDLDHTLWDFARNSRETLEELFHDFEVYKEVSDFEAFFETYHQINDAKWEAYRKGLLTKEQLRASRFSDTLLQFGIRDAHRGLLMDKQYLERSPYKKHLFPGTLEVLGALYEKYKLHIVTNGFIEVQHIKLKSSGLIDFFEHTISSEQVGVNKPDPRIFTYALRQAGAHRKTALMVGDHWEADIQGARSVGMDQAYFVPHANPEVKEATYIIRDLRELLQFL
jgi:putative hydrolase of the HAD superfamily